MPTFRVHYETGDPVIVDAETPVEARAKAQEIRLLGRITKVKVVKEKADG